MRGDCFLVIGASSGIGLSICQSLKGVGAQVVGASRTIEPCPAFDHIFQLDVADEAQILSLFDHILDMGLCLKGVIYSVGYCYASAAASIAADDLRTQFDVNFFGAALCIKSFIAHREGKEGRGTILVVSSIAGQIGMPFQAAYSASKFALEGFCQALRLEIADQGIDVCLLRPGDVATSFRANRKTNSALKTDERGARVLSLYEKNELAGIDAARVSSLALKMLGSPKRSAARAVGKPTEIAGYLARRLLPFLWFERMMTFVYLRPH